MEISDKEIQIEKRIKSTIKYKPNINKWCNTLLIFAPNSDNIELWRVNPGIGVSGIHKMELLQLPIRSHWIFLSEDELQKLIQIGVDYRTLRPVRNLGITGIIYENTLSGCPPIKG